jgi:hypothetical protein
MSVVSVVCCRVEISASADQSPRGVLPCVVCVCECDRQATTVRFWPTSGCCAIKKIYIIGRSQWPRGLRLGDYGANFWLYIEYGPL